MPAPLLSLRKKVTTTDVALYQPASLGSVVILYVVAGGVGTGGVGVGVGVGMAVGRTIVTVF
jgi:hypothetical protein